MLPWVEINLNAYRKNLEVIKSILDPETQVMAVVKANAYGHGLEESARTIWTSGADQLAVINVDEGIALRVAKIKAPILILGYIENQDIRRALDFDLGISVFDIDQARRISDEARIVNRWAKVHFKVDTGMHRFGFDPIEAMDAISEIIQLEHIKVEGIYSHFADASNISFSKKQIMEMRNILFKLQQMGVNAWTTHMAATDATANYQEAHFDMVRVGLGVYGLTDKIEGLEPVLSFRTKIGQIRRLGPGESIGYGLTYKTDKPSKIAVIQAGYADGYPRALSNNSEIIVRRKRAKVVGRICMNIMMADVTGINAQPGDVVTLIGSQDNATLKATELADWAGTNVHEIVTGISANLHREYKNN